MASSWAASALDWWEEAGVDTIVGETPRDWLKPARRRPRAAPAEPPAPAPLPDTLDAFHDWLATSAELPFAAPVGAARGAGRAIPASGLMILVDMPSRRCGGPAVGRGRRPVRPDAGRDRPRPRDRSISPPLSPIRTPTGAIDDGERGAARRDRPPPYRPRRAQGAARCSATFAARPWSARRSPAPAAAGTKSPRKRARSRLW